MTRLNLKQPKNTYRFFLGLVGFFFIIIIISTCIKIITAAEATRNTVAPGAGTFGDVCSCYRLYVCGGCIVVETNSTILFATYIKE